jgi:outer membrane protein OmpA-like peptidoglycan-associated protein
VAVNPVSIIFLRARLPRETRLFEVIDADEDLDVESLSGGRGLAGAGLFDITPVDVAEDQSVLHLDPITVLYVSLFLILFAFFAVLNTHGSTSDQQAKAVMDSLGASFGGKGRERLFVSEIKASDVTILSGPKALIAARQEIETVFPDVVLKSLGDTAQVQVDLPLDQFFVSGAVRLAPSKELFLKSIAEAVTANPATRIVVLLGFSSADLQRAEFQRRAALIAATLSRYGVSSDALTLVSHSSGSNVFTLTARVD